ncbi:DUF503 family protein [Paludibaculum fermentans]|uniref:DUF503 family protein n=1 Tax=Paludibaculum fermentans TaxID=1473598 RepID=UPI001E6354AB|nr:DUF503 family protein [Paludibaculum fermentans]
MSGCRHSSVAIRRLSVAILKDRLRAGLNVTVAEVQDQNRLNRSVVTVSGSRANAMKVLDSAERAAAAFLGPNLVSSCIEWVE